MRISFSPDSFNYGFPASRTQSNELYPPPGRNFRSAYCPASILRRGTVFYITQPQKGAGQDNGN